jgi:hypothetical protein
LSWFFIWDIIGAGIGVDAVTRAVGFHKKFFSSRVGLSEAKPNTAVT